MTFQTADIILVKVNRFSTWYRKLLGKLIQFFDGVYYHHGGTIAGMYFYQADTRVVRDRPEVSLMNDEIIVLRLRTPLTARETYLYEKMTSEALGRKYDYLGTLFHQLIYILTFRRIWIGKTGPAASRRPYCTEFAVEPIHRLRGYFPQPWKLGPSGLLKVAPLYYDVVFEGVYQPLKDTQAA